MSGIENGNGLENRIEIRNVSKNYGDVCALETINLTFKENKIYGLLGRNGAGKSTLLNIITNRIFPNSGEVLINNVPAAENDKALQKIYMMSEQTMYPDKMKVRDAIKWSRDFYPEFDMEYAKELADQFHLNTNKRIKGLSTGYNSIFKIIIALSVNTPFVLLDEPVLGLDANHRDLFYRILIEKYSKHPCTFIISTHLIEEVSNLIEDIIIIKDGGIITNESCEELLSKGYTISGNASLVDRYISDKEVIGTDILGGLKTAYILGKPNKATLPDTLELTKLNMQKLFIQLTNTQGEKSYES